MQQHLKAVYDKTGARSRQALVAQIFAQQYAPHMHAGIPLGADGWYADPARARVALPRQT